MLANNPCADNILSPSSYIEKHTLTGSEDVLRFAVGKNVILNVDTQQEGLLRVRDSARANSQILSEYKWEKREGGIATGNGRILAVRDKLVAYHLFNGATGEAVRVMERESRTRQLIKDFRYQLVDLQWAMHVPLLAVLDANANIYVYSVEENGLKLAKYLNIIHDGEPVSKNGPSSAAGRLVWCPYIPEQEEDIEVGRDEIHLLGVVQGSTVNLFQLHRIKKSIGRTEVSYSRVKDACGGLLSVQLDSPISACKISPDATAMAVATTDGYLSFFVLDEASIQLASRIQPLTNNHIEELIFLDNLCVDSQEQFWKYAVLGSDNGRRLAIFDCDTWECLAKLRFECPNLVGRMEILVDPSTHFLFLVDYDMSNLFCIELSSTQQPGTPICFAACTLITFCSQFLSIVPSMLTEPLTDSGGDLSLEDDDGVGAGRSTAIATLVAITHRALSEINLELDRFHTVDPSVAIVPAQQQQQQCRSHQSLVEQPHPQPQMKDPSKSEPPGATDFIDLLQKNAVSTNHAMPPSSMFPSSSGLNDIEQVKQMLAEIMEQKNGPIMEKMEELSLGMHQLREENERLKSSQNDNLSNVLEKISNELKLREERIEQTVRKACEEVLRGNEKELESFVGQRMQRTLDMAQSRMAEQLRGTVERSVVPQVEVLCTQLFRQLNDTFRAGLQEFMEQIRGIQQQQQAAMMARQGPGVAAGKNAGGGAAGTGVTNTSQPPPIDENSLARFLESNQARLAFELVINKGDQQLLNFVCSKVDPDDYFALSASSNAAPLPMHLLLGLLRMLAAKLEADTADLRIRYIENVLLWLNNKQTQLSREEFQKMVVVIDGAQFKRTLDQLNKALNAFSEKEIAAPWKRQTRMISQLTMNLLRSA